MIKHVGSEQHAFLTSKVTDIFIS